jgi:RAB protein geranylgeranyltransferase component A
MDEDLPSTFDVVLIGTGLTESIVSAAAARNGHTVLHIDPRDYYGGKWGTFAWNDWVVGNFTEKPKTIPETARDLIWTNEIRELEQVWYTENESIKQDVSQSSKKFNIDIFPKVLMAREPMIQLLIQSNVSRYLEFKCISKLLSSLPAPDNHIIDAIPISKSDIFTTKAISLIEKRCLMKFIEYVLKTPPAVDPSSELNDSGSPVKPEDIPPTKTFEELVKLHKISPKVKHFIQSAVRSMDDCSTIAMKAQDDDCHFNSDFTERCRLFLESIGRYGNQTPFLWTLYGISEICQAFCRLSAIYGGIFILKRPFESVEEDQETGMINIKSAGTEIKAKYLILSPELRLANPAGESSSSSPKNRQHSTLVRGVMLVTGPRLKADLGDGGNLAVYKFDDMDVFELDETSLATTKKYRLLQVTCPFHGSYSSENQSAKSIIESKLKSFIDFVHPLPVPRVPIPNEEGDEGIEVDESPPDQQMQIEQEEPLLSKPLVHYGSYFFIDFFEDPDLEDHKNIFSCATSSTEITDHVKKARQVFEKMYPGEDFLPKAPDAADQVDADLDDEDSDMPAVAVTNGDAHEVVVPPQHEQPPAVGEMGDIAGDN